MVEPGHDKATLARRQGDRHLPNHESKIKVCDKNKPMYALLLLCGEKERKPVDGKFGEVQARSEEPPDVDDERARTPTRMHALVPLHFTSPLNALLALLSTSSLFLL